MPPKAKPCPLLTSSTRSPSDLQKRRRLSLDPMPLMRQNHLKTTLAGAHHAFNYRKYADHYLAGFAYRFNRRFDLHTLVVRLIVAVARGKPRSEQVIRQAESHC